MGNQVERLTHLTYNEVPTADPAGLDADLGSQIGVSYIFSDEEEHVEEDGGISTQDTTAAADHSLADDIEYTVYHIDKCIFSKRRTCAASLRTYLPDVLASRCKAGDLVEFVRALQQPHWAVWVGNGQVVHLCKQEVKREPLALASRGWRGRVVSDWYRFKPLELELVVQNACRQVGWRAASAADTRWHTSESFAAWCRYARREFKSGGEIRIGKQPYTLKVYLQQQQQQEEEEEAEDQHVAMSFQSLEDVIGERRKRDKQGKGALLQELRQEL